MTSKSEKLLAKLDSKQRQAILEVLKKLKVGDESNLDIKPLKGHKYLFRVRVGAYRILYMRHSSTFKFIGLSKRDSQTYRDF
jgi:mRNA-degrading endonuclease RelE of RelBE toxin-antitoxin system